jgi:transcriptional regulator with XRE-family HTH domain
VGKQKTPHVDDPAAVGRRLRESRERAGLSQRELAGTECTAAYVSRLELGQRVPSIQLLRLLGRRLGVSADYLATGELGTSTLLDAEVALRLDDLDTVWRLFEQALDEHAAPGGDRSEALAGLGQLAFRDGRFSEAIDLLSASVQASGLDAVELPGVAATLARAYAATGELSPSLALLERCVERSRARATSSSTCASPRCSATR